MGDRMGERIADALRAACHPHPPSHPSVGVMLAIAPSGGLPMTASGIARPVPGVALDDTVHVSTIADVDALVATLFEEEGQSLVRLARLFVDDRNAAEDLVQEGFIRLARNAHKIRDLSRAAAYLRSIVLNLTRDHNRRGLVSVRHHLPTDDDRASLEDEIVLEDDRQEVIDALRALPQRQRDCLVLRYYDELGVEAIAETLGISPNSVKTHLKRGLVAMQVRIDSRSAVETGAAS